MEDEDHVGNGVETSCLTLTKPKRKLVVLVRHHWAHPIRGSTLCCASSLGKEGAEVEFCSYLIGLQPTLAIVMWILVLGCFDLFGFVETGPLS